MNLENLYNSLQIKNHEENSFRDPMSNINLYEKLLEKNLYHLSKCIDYAKTDFNHPELLDAGHRWGVIRSAFSSIIIMQDLFYSRGDSIEVVSQHLSDALLLIEKLRPLRIRFEAEAKNLVEEEVSYGFSIFTTLIQQVFMIVQDPNTLRRWMKVTGYGHFYIGDVLVRSFTPDWPIAKKYGKLDRYDNIRMHHGLQTVLSAPDKAGKQAGIERYMAQWNGMMRPFGWKPKRNYDPRPGYGDDLFLKFAYEAALVVCGWDLDDSAFRAHPYYPRDLVDYYRAHVRHTRDAWRPEGIGAGIPVMPPPPSKKIDLHKSKAKGYKRWLELTCDGDKNACTDTLEALGTLRSLKNSWDEVLDQLSGNGHAVRADLKDPDTLQAQIDALATQRPLAEFTPPDNPPAGPDRCEMLMQQAPAWAAAQDYTWQALDDGGDNWQAVLIRTEFHAEWLALSAALHLPPGLLGL